MDYVVNGTKYTDLTMDQAKKELYYTGRIIDILCINELDKLGRLSGAITRLLGLCVILTTISMIFYDWIYWGDQLKIIILIIISYIWLWLWYVYDKRKIVVDAVDAKYNEVLLCIDRLQETKNTSNEYKEKVFDDLSCYIGLDITNEDTERNNSEN